MGQVITSPDLRTVCDRELAIPRSAGDERVAVIYGARACPALACAWDHTIKQHRRSLASDR